MIKLESNFKNSMNNAIFYFNTISDCEAFKYVFKDHWCNVPWKTPIEVTNITLTAKQIAQLDVDPRKRADNNISWGFSACKFERIDLDKEQESFINSLMSKLD